MSPSKMLAFIPFLMAVAIAMFLGATVIHGIKNPMDVFTIPVLFYCFSIVGLGVATIGLSASAVDEK